MSTFLHIWCKSNTSRIVKTCPFHFLVDNYGDSLDVMFPQFPNNFLPFPIVFPYVSFSVSTISSGISAVSFSVSPVSYFRFCVESIHLLFRKRHMYQRGTCI